MGHELGHDKIAKGEVDVKAVRERLAEKVGGKENVDLIARYYAEAYASTGMTEDEIWEETICDSLGEMNVFEADGKYGSAFMAEMLPKLKEAAGESAGRATNPEAVAEGRASRETKHEINIRYDNTESSIEKTKLGENITNVADETYKSEFLRRNANDPRSGSSEISSESGGIVSDGNKGGVFAGTSEGGILSYDTEGRVISDELISKIKNTAIKDKNGNPIAVYHATSKNFEKFSIGDIGFHFGNKFQATSRAENKKIDSPNYIRAYLNIENPLIIEKDYMNWHANSVALNMLNEGIFNDAEKDSVISLWAQGREYDSPAAVKVREILRDKGYDGIAYKNEFEGEGYSFIAFDNEQIVRSSDGKGKASQELDYIDYINERAERAPRGEEIRGYKAAEKALQNRQLLANALESVNEYPSERGLLASYRATAEKLERAEQRIAEIDSDIKVLSKDKKNAGIIEMIRKEKASLTEDIHRADRQLLNLEAAKPLKRVIERERQKAKEEYLGKLNELREKARTEHEATVQEYREARAKSVEGRHKSAARGKIKALKEKFIKIYFQ